MDEKACQNLYQRTRSWYCANRGSHYQKREGQTLTMAWDWLLAKDIGLPTISCLNYLASAAELESGPFPNTKNALSSVKQPVRFFVMPQVLCRLRLLSYQRWFYLLPETEKSWKEKVSNEKNKNSQKLTKITYVFSLRKMNIINI